MLITKQVNIWHEVETAAAGYVSTDDQPGADILLNKWNTTSIEEKKVMSKNAISCFNKNFEIGNAVKSLLEVLST